MERRHAQMFEIESTDLDESVDGSVPTIVVSAAPLQACVRASAATVRQVVAGRLPGKAFGTQPPRRKARVWSIEPPYETAAVDAIPLPGERASAAVTLVQETPRWRKRESPNAAVTIVQAVPLATRACEAPIQYSVEREVSALTVPRPATRPWDPRDRRRGHVLVLIIGMLAGFMTVLSVVVVRQQRDLETMAEPARRANQACAAYADEVRAELENPSGDRRRRVLGDRAMQRLCAPEVDVACAQHDETACVVQLRQALARR
ncbi:MAG: hypothetical protein H0T42_32075 [Deltaproteobacteria bacterium]|nr:hypothetical protein [Deltaproteobacteria bacterium]